MKKILSMILILSMLYSMSTAFAEDSMGVQIIGDYNTEPVSLDNIIIGEEVEIDSYAILLPTKFAWQDTLPYYEKGQTTHSSIFSYYLYSSGSDAEYAIIYMDITNATSKPKSFLNNCDVKCIFEGSTEIEYSGWYYQQNYDNHLGDEYVIDHADEFTIGPMYTGHYVFGCTLPNAVVNSKKPLRMVITIDGTEITYNIRK